MTNKHMTKEQLLELSDDQRRALTNAEFFATTEGLELTIDNDNDKRIAAEADRRGLIGEMIYYLVRRQWWDMCDPENLENARKENSRNAGRGHRASTAGAHTGELREEEQPE